FLVARVSAGHALRAGGLGKPARDAFGSRDASLVLLLVVADSSPRVPDDLLLDRPLDSDRLLLDRLLLGLRNAPGRRPAPLLPPRSALPLSFRRPPENAPSASDSGLLLGLR